MSRHNLVTRELTASHPLSRPELVDDPSKDYAISAMDPYESSLMPQASGSTPGPSSSSNPMNGLMEGKGMLSWNLAERHKGTTWVTGRVTGTPRKQPESPEAGEDDEEDDSDDEGGDEALEVHLQLVEVSLCADWRTGWRGADHRPISQRPAFTQTQFLTSLRSFAQPAPSVAGSDKASSPVRRPPIASSVSAPVKPIVGPPGDPIKKKRTRDSLLPTRQLRPSASLPAISEANDQLAALKDPKVLSLLTQLLPSLAGQSSEAAAAPVPAELATALGAGQGQALLPALRTLAKFYGFEVPGLAASTSEASAPLRPPPRPLNKGKGRASNSGDTPLASSSNDAFAQPSSSTSRQPGKAPQFTAIPTPEGRTDNFNPLDPAGCFNCKRKKSTVWREMFTETGEHVTACNACGIHYNRHGTHRTKGTATSPVRAAGAPSSNTRSSLGQKGRPLKSSLTATCERDLRKIKQQRRTTIPGMVAPPSPSKHVGPSLRSPNSIFRSGGGTSLFPKMAMTSPTRSPRRGTSAFLGYSATSPISRSPRRGGGGGYESDGEARVGTGGGIDFAAMFADVNQSPSPAKRTSNVPSYLLTASPGTALNRILNDTSCDMNSFDMSLEDYPVTRSASRRAAAAQGSTSPGGLPTRPSTPSLGDSLLGEHDLSFFLRSSPLGGPDKDHEKENNRPSHEPAFVGNPSLAHLAPTTDTTSAEYESLLSSLRRDFENKFSSRAVTTPSSPAGSSPCVQPRTSQATPGTKGKAPQSCGRPAPSILNSFIDSLEPALAQPLEGETPASEDDAWAGQSVERTMSYTDLSGAVHQTDPMSYENMESTSGAGNGDLFSVKSRRMVFPSHVFTNNGQLSDAGPTSDFDFGSLPPSSPPALPSEPFATPEEEGYHSDDDEVTQMGISSHAPGAEAGENSALAALLEAYGGAPSTSGEGASSTTELSQALLGHGNGKIQLDRSTINKLLGMLAAQASAEGAGSAAVASADVFGPAAGTRAGRKAK